MFNLIVARRNLIKIPYFIPCFIHKKSLKTEKPLIENDSLSSSSRQSKFSVFEKIKINTTMIPDIVVNTFKIYDFTDAQITKTLTKFPQLLTANMDKIIKPKLDYYLNLGYSRGELGKFISTNPRALMPSLERRIKPNVKFLRSYLESDQQLFHALHRSCKLLGGNINLTLLPNIKTLELCGVGHAHIAKFINGQPRKLMWDGDKFAKVVKTINELGFDPMSFVFVRAVNVFSGQNPSTWDKKLVVYKSLGLSEKDIDSAFLKFPECMALSLDKIKRGFDFYAKELHWEPSFVVGRPVLLGLSLEKRVIPRCSVMSILASKGFVRKYPSRDYQFLLMSKTIFLEKYVTKYKDQVPEVLDVFKIESKVKN